MYENIGVKIKGWAKASFIVEAIASVITGIALWIDTEEWWCALILFCGPILAWVSSWLIYGFGEIIDKLREIELNTRGGQSKIKIKETAEKAEKEEVEHMQRERIESILKKQNTKVISNAPSTKRCPHCGENISSSVCDMCGKSNNLFN